MLGHERFALIYADALRQLWGDDKSMWPEVEQSASEEASHRGELQCNCGHRLGRHTPPLPGFAGHHHLDSQCLWTCCGASWSDVKCSSAGSGGKLRISMGVDTLAAADPGSAQEAEALGKLTFVGDAMAKRVMQWEASWKDIVKCEVCLEAAPSRYCGYDDDADAECAHHSVVCQQCLRTYLKTAISNGGVKESGVKCLHSGCDKRMPDSGLRSILNKPDMQQYLRFKRLAVISADPARRWCPAAGCHGVVTISESTNCPVCGASVCEQCGSLSHAGKSCEAAADSGLAALAKEKGWKSCPFCGKLVERTAGCSSMTCRHLGCERRFCYSCAKHPCTCHEPSDRDD